MKLKVNGAGAVVDLFHLDPFGIPIGKRLLVARYVHVAFHVFALKLDVNRIRLFAHVLLKERRTELKILIHSLREAG